MLLSVITINLNNANGLLNTAKSIIKQSSKNFEWIIIDGGSADKSCEIISSYQQHVNYWVSEADNGIFHAMNKGIQKAKGNYLLFLNSGDQLHNEQIIAQIIPLLQHHSVYYTRALYISDEDHKSRIIRYPKNLDIDFFLKNSLNHQNCIFKKSLFDKYGLYDDQYKICADWDFMFRLFLNRETFVYIEKIIISRFYRDGISSNYKALENERTQAIFMKYPEYKERYQKLLIRKRSLLNRIKNRIRRSLMYHF